jgi:hypothetical protein
MAGLGETGLRETGGCFSVEICISTYKFVQYSVQAMWDVRGSGVGHVALFGKQFPGFDRPMVEA